MIQYAVVINSDKARNYLVAETKEEIDSYCLENSYEIIGRPQYVEPGMVAHHFIWVGKNKRPGLLDISKPNNY